MSRKVGDRFQEDIANSCEKLEIFNHRIKDVTPNMLKSNIRVSPNKFDYFAYYKYYLFPMELKTTAGKSFSFSEKIIKPHQIKYLTKADKYDGVTSGFIFNFREYDNQTFFVHIDDFNTYKNIAENKLEHNYESKVNEASIPLDICNEIGYPVQSFKKKVRYHYIMNKLFDELINKYG